MNRSVTSTTIGAFVAITFVAALAVWAAWAGSEVVDSDENEMASVTEVPGALTDETACEATGLCRCLGKELLSSRSLSSIEDGLYTPSPTPKRGPWYHHHSALWYRSAAPMRHSAPMAISPPRYDAKAAERIEQLRRVIRRNDTARTVRGRFRRSFATTCIQIARGIYPDLETSVNSQTAAMLLAPRTMPQIVDLAIAIDTDQSAKDENKYAALRVVFEYHLSALSAPSRSISAHAAQAIKFALCPSGRSGENCCVSELETIVHMNIVGDLISLEMNDGSRLPPSLSGSLQCDAA